jgi:hypothetical protein
MDAEESPATRECSTATTRQPDEKGHRSARSGLPATELGAATPTPWVDWATLQRRTFDLDVLSCPCDRRLRLIALVTEREALAEVLVSLGLPTTPPVRARRAVPDAIPSATSRAS